MIKVKASGTINLDDIQKLNTMYPNQKIIIVINNTKLQNPDTLKLIGEKYSNITFSVLGGLDPKKQKFNDEYYQERTYYTGLELSKIVNIYKSIEKKIDLSWTDTQKAMFVYKKLCDSMAYEECKCNGRDQARGIGGLLYGKAVCSGFAMIYKEAMDRLGIECYYQNREGHHSWNIVKLDGEYRGIELTWDTYNKGPNGCGFNYFNIDKNFYGNEHHDISGEKEEIKYPIVPYSIKEIQDNYATIQRPNTATIPLKPYDKDTIISDNITINGISCKVYIKNNIIGIATPTEKSIVSKTFVRKDGSSFIVIPSSTAKYKSVNKYVILESREQSIKIGKIYTEMQLENADIQYYQDIAEGLLSKERLARKINSFNGYIGYLGTNHGIYYDSNFEKENLNITR